MGGGVGEGGDLVVVAGNAVQGLGYVSCPLQNDLLGGAEKVQEVELFMVLCSYRLLCFDAWFTALRFTCDTNS